MLNFNKQIVHTISPCRMLSENWESIFAKPDQLFVRNKQTNLIFIRKLQLVFTSVKKVIESNR